MFSDSPQWYLERQKYHNLSQDPGQPRRISIRPKLIIFYINWSQDYIAALLFNLTLCRHHSVKKWHVQHIRQLDQPNEWSCWTTVAAVLSKLDSLAHRVLRYKLVSWKLHYLYQDSRKAYCGALRYRLDLHGNTQYRISIVLVHNEV